MLQSSASGFTFGGLFALALTASQFDACVLHGAFEQAIVVGAGGRQDAILGRLAGEGLEVFLKFPFGVFQNRDHLRLAASGAELLLDESRGGVEAAIEIEGTHQRFKAIGQRRLAIAAAGKFLPRLTSR